MVLLSGILPRGIHQDPEIVTQVEVTMDPRECKSDVLEVSREGVVPTFGCLWFGVRTRF